jgi:hypothetical protein
MATAAVLSRKDAAQPSQAEAVGTTGLAAAPGDPTIGASTRPSVVTTPVAASSRGEVAVAARTNKPEGFAVTLEADGPSWVSATVDGQRQLYQVIPAGTKHTLRGSREIVLRVGDAGSVRWSVNGREAAPMGNPGEVRNVTVTPDGVR